MSTTANPPLTDLGTAPPPPAWCLPEATPEHYELTEEYGGGEVAGWTREFGQDVWISCDDHTVDGRIMRSEPRIMYFEPPRDGVTSEQAHQVALELLEAAGVINEAARS